MISEWTDLRRQDMQQWLEVDNAITARMLELAGGSITKLWLFHASYKSKALHEIMERICLLERQDNG